ncbi:MAG: hypothetical protein WC719_03065 [Patescibacteria group bacterium]|jgi:hypothetical protein
MMTEPVFRNSQGETLPLAEIAKKNIVSVKIAYFSEKGIAQEMEIANKQLSLRCLLKGATIVIGLPSEIKEYERIEQSDHDENSLCARFLSSGLCQLFLPLTGLKKIEWTS